MFWIGLKNPLDSFRPFGPWKSATYYWWLSEKKRISEASSAHFLALLAELPIIVEQESPERMVGEIFALARKHNLSSYDASYLDLAMRKGLPIATLDKNLLAAAKRSKVQILSGK